MILIIIIIIILALNELPVSTRSDGWVVKNIIYKREVKYFQGRFEFE